MVMSMNCERYRTGEMICFQGEPAHSFYIVKSGKVAVEKDNRVVSFLSSGNYFGEDA